MTTPVHPYWPLQDTSRIKYVVGNFDGFWHSSTCHFDVTTRTPYNGLNRVQEYITRRVNFSYPLFAQTVSTETTPDQGTITPNNTLCESVHYTPTVSWVGEIINQTGYIQVPPIALLHFNPTAGTELNEVSDIYSNSEKLFKFPWKSRCIHVGKPWGPWADTVRMALLENPSAPEPQGYNYIFAKGIGLVHFWKGTIRPDFTCRSGWEWWAFEW